MSQIFGFDIRFEDLYSRDGLAALDARFCAEIEAADTDLFGRFMASRADFGALSAKDEAALLVALAPHLDDFLAKLFGIEAEARALTASHHDLAPLYACKRLFVQRRALKAFPPGQAAAFDGAELRASLEALIGADFTELAFAKAVVGWLEDDKANAAALDIAARYAAWSVQRAGHGHASTVLFKIPKKHDPLKMIPVETVVRDGVTMLQLPETMLRRRDGFALTDHGTDLAGALDQVNYCILCHHQGKDSCSKGMRDKQTGAFARTAVGSVQTGCPLEEKISEMHEVKGQGLAMGALAVIAIDNPMAAGTGHRICNDCMAGCIYTNQNRDPVDIPQAETRTLKDVLELPYGFEIYSLLTRWNPLNLRRPLPRPATGHKVLVAGLGPAGYTLAHHLMNDGHAVVAVDGLKIEPLPAEISGIDPYGKRTAFRPIKNVTELYEPLESRMMAGFGGVAEYGITVRWNKNFLKVIRLLLERRAEFLMFGGVRFGGSLTLETAFEMGFDHVALAMGAGRPTVLSMPNGLAKGVRQASDFLMALQLTGAARKASIANLQLRMPVVVIGGGLTAIDTCTEALAYYPIQVEKFMQRYEELVAQKGEAGVRAGWGKEEAAVGEEFLAHARAIRGERRAAEAEGRPARVRELLDSWGGVTLAYRRTMVESPAYRNHEEVAKAFEEGIRIAEKLTPLAIEIDQFGHAKGLKVKDGDGREIVLPAKGILVAAGTVPNTVLAREEPGIELDGKYFQAVDEEGRPVHPEKLTKPESARVLMALEQDGRAISFFGDLHPSYAGNVVSAMASAKQGYPVVSRVLARKRPSPVSTGELFARLNQEIRAQVEYVQRLAPTIVEVVVRAPLAARTFQPGQFYRLQNFEALAPHAADGTLLAMEGLALTGAWVDRDKGLVSLIVLEMGGSSDLVRHLKPGEPVVVMGPTGTPTEIEPDETVLLAGGGLGNAVLFSIGQAFRRIGSKVLYFAGYRRAVDRFKVEEIEAAADVVIWCVDQGEAFVPTRPQDRAFVGNIVQAMKAYAEGALGEVTLPLSDVDRIIAIGSDRMMAAVAQSRHDVLAPYFNPSHVAIGSINSPMQCMMKEICAQCLQIQKDPETGEERVVFTCFNQDQPLDSVDFSCLSTRLQQNAVQEKLSHLWIARSLADLAAE